MPCHLWDEKIRQRHVIIKGVIIIISINGLNINKKMNDRINFIKLMQNMPD
jgi:hypothetical protein